MVNNEQLNAARDGKSPMELWIPEVGKVLGDCTGADLTQMIAILESRAETQRATLRRLEQLAGLKVTEAAQAAKSARPKLPRKA